MIIHTCSILDNRIFNRKYLIFCKDRKFYEALSGKCYLIIKKYSFKNFAIILQS